MNHGAVFVHRNKRCWLLPTVDRELHDLMVFAVKKEKSVDIVKMISPFGLNLLRILTTLDW